MKLTLDELNRLAACPECKAPLVLERGVTAECSSCGARYAWMDGTWDFTPSDWQPEGEWKTWETLQENGLVSYTMDPNNNLSMNERPAIAAFGRFCDFRGLVLDVGCGPQAWPAYFSDYAEGTRFVGIDPLIENGQARYTQLRGLGEHLPFQSGSFDRITFATSLDHFVDPGPVLLEAARTLNPGGTLNIWIGEKKGQVKREVESPQWYENLERPEGAEDVFHIKRLSLGDLRVALQGLNFQDHTETSLEEERHIHYFVSLKAAA